MNQERFLDIATFSPRSLCSPNAWVGHLPFAALLMQELSPTLFVELGTHTANSYFSFCQAVAEFELPTRCYAVDTWQGDEHAGAYDETIFNQVDSHNRQHYSAFSTLMRTTFDEAVSSFADGSIDLLHIDGLHTYDAVRHDFVTWQPKLAPGAVVLFHDTNVREGDFGVWRLWEELQGRYPNHLEFLHSNGLGVLQIDGGAKEKRISWLQAGSAEQERVVAYFSALGDRQMQRHRVTELSQLVADHEGAIGRLYDTVSHREGVIAELDAKVVDRDLRLIALHEAHAALNLELEAVSLALRESEEKYRAIENSTIWKMTAPLRSFLDHNPRFRKVSRRVAELTWWTLTGQLFRQLQEQKTERLAKAAAERTTADGRKDNQA